MEIKILGFFSLFTILRTIVKIINRDDLTCVDVILLSYTIYFAIIPIVGDVSFIGSDMIINSSLSHWYVFIVYNIFAYSLVLFDYNYCKKANTDDNVYFLTRFIRNWINNLNLNKQWIYLTVTLLILQIIILSSNFQTIDKTILGSMDDIRKASSFSFFSLFTGGGGTTIRIVTIFMLSSIVFNKDKELYWNNKIIVNILIVTQILLLFFLNRTYFFESILIFLLLFYGCQKEYISNANIIRMALLLSVIVVFIFPVISVIRTTTRYMTSKGLNKDLSNVIITSYNRYTSGKINITKADNKDSRMWGCYSIVAKSIFCDYEGNGEIISNAISKGIPKVIYPSKSITGSQLIIEKKFKTMGDVADSVLLAGIAENRILGPILASFFFLILVYIYNLFYRIFKLFTKYELYVPLILSSLFCWLLRVEHSIDGLVSGFIGLSILNICMFVYVKIVGYLLKIRL